MALVIFQKSFFKFFFIWAIWSASAIFEVSGLPFLKCFGGFCSKGAVGAPEEIKDVYSASSTSATNLGHEGSPNLLQANEGIRPFGHESQSIQGSGFSLGSTSRGAEMHLRKPSIEELKDKALSKSKVEFGKITQFLSEHTDVSEINKLEKASEKIKACSKELADTENPEFWIESKIHRTNLIHLSGNLAAYKVIEEDEIQRLFEDKYFVKILTSYLSENVDTAIHDALFSPSYKEMFLESSQAEDVHSLFSALDEDHWANFLNSYIVNEVDIEKVIEDAKKPLAELGSSSTGKIPSAIQHSLPSTISAKNDLAEEILRLLVQPQADRIFSSSAPIKQVYFKLYHVLDYLVSFQKVELKQDSIGWRLFSEWKSILEGCKEIEAGFEQTSRQALSSSALYDMRNRVIQQLLTFKREGVHNVFLVLSINQLQKLNRFFPREAPLDPGLTNPLRK